MARGKLPSVGDRFGRLVIVSAAERIPGRGTRWLVLCDCGAERVVTTSALNAGTTVSCGCKKRDHIRIFGRRPQHTPIAVGARFGRLTIVSGPRRVIRGGALRVVYDASCDCGGSSEVVGCELRRKTVSCGCLREEASRAARHISDEEVLAKYSIPEPNTGCLLWCSPTIKTGGYGSVNRFGKSWVASRLAYVTFVGPIPPGMHVCHRCDTPPCINPSHLFLGTPMDNRLDMLSKGRAFHQKLNAARAAQTMADKLNAAGIR